MKEDNQEILGNLLGGLLGYCCCLTIFILLKGKKPMMLSPNSVPDPRACTRSTRSPGLSGLSVTLRGISLGNGLLSYWKKEMTRCVSKEN